MVNIFARMTDTFHKTFYLVTLREEFDFHNFEIFKLVFFCKKGLQANCCRTSENQISVELLVGRSFRLLRV